MKNHIVSGSGIDERIINLIKAVTSRLTGGLRISNTSDSRTTALCKMLGVILSLNLCLMTKLILMLTLTDPHNTYKEILSEVETLTTANTLTTEMCV